MHFSNAVLALAGLSSLATAAPAAIDRRHAALSHHVPSRAIKAKRNKNNNNNNNNNNRNSGNTIIIEQTIIEPTVVVVQENLGLISQLALIAEQEFSALIQAQLALVQEIEIIKNNIRVNHFLARFTEVNTVIVTVTEVVDVRNAASPNKRYMVNQQLADHGNAQSTVVVMLTASSPMTIGLPTPSLDLSGILGAAASALPSEVAASVVSDAAASATAAAASAAANAVTFSNTTVAGNAGNSSSSGQVASFDPNNPFGQFNQSIILPYGSQAPNLSNTAQIVSDPAAIILPNQANLLVEDVNQFSQDCVVLESASTLFNLQSSVLQAEQIAAQLLGGLSLGVASSLNSAVAALFGVAGAGSASTAAAAIASSSSIASATAAAVSPVSVSTTAAVVSAAPTTVAVAQSSPVEVPAVEVSAAPAVETSSAAVAEAAATEAAPKSSSNGVGVQIVPVQSAAAA